MAHSKPQVKGYTRQVNRRELIQQLREALYLAESPNEEFPLFTIGDYEFEFDFSEESS